MTRIDTSRLTLRKARPGDVEDYWRMFSDPECMRYWSSPPHADQSETGAMLARHAASPDPVTYFAWVEEGRVIGCGGAPGGRQEIGYMLARDRWGQGLAQEAMAAIIDYLWQITDHPQLTADVDPLNRASVMLLTRLGFVASGYAARTFHVAGTWSDSVYFRLPRPETA